MHHARPGQALRGSSELHAWGDSNLYLRRRERILLTAEHRAAPGLADSAIELTDHGQGLALRLGQAADEQAVEQAPEQRLLQVLGEAETPLSLRELRERAPRGGYRLAGDAAETAATTAPPTNGEALPKTVTGPKPQAWRVTVTGNTPAAWHPATQPRKTEKHA